MIQYHALRKVDERTEHVAWHDDEDEAKEAMRIANGV